MSYVPIIVTPPEPPSPRVLELSAEFSKIIEEYERRFPDLSSHDVRQAAKLALESRHKGSVDRRPVIATAVGIAALLAGVVTFFFAQGGGEAPSIPIVMVLVVGLMLVGGIFAVIKRMGE